MKGKEKEKQIEEMAKIIDYQLGDLCGPVVAAGAAQALYDAGYRKIASNAVLKKIALLFNTLSGGDQVFLIREFVLHFTKNIRKITDYPRNLLMYELKDDFITASCAIINYQIEDEIRGERNA